MTEAFRGTHHIQVDDGYVSYDSTYFPIVVLWWGGNGSERLFDESWAFRDAKLADHAPMMIFINSIDDAKPLDAKLRKYLADKGQFDPYAKAIRSIVLVSNPIMRGVMTAVKWIAGDKFPIELSGTIEQAFRVSQRILEEQDIEVTLPQNYAIVRNPSWKG